MTNDKHKGIPPELHARLNDEAPAEREAIEQVWHLLGENHPYDGAMPDAEETWSRLQDAVSDTNGRPAHRYADRAPAPRRKKARSYVGWIAGVAAVILVALGALLWLSQPLTVTAPAGERVAHALPDGSTVELRGGSSLSYLRNFSALPFTEASERAVTVEGEAYFEVSSAGTPFLVETFNANIEVLGTEFDVQAWSGVEQPETRVTLASGEVRVRSKATVTEGVTLQSIGQTSRVVGTEMPTPPQESDLDQVLAWRHDGFHASDQSLSAILKRLESRFGVEITLQASEVATESMTLFYSRQIDLETILYDICVAKGLKYRPTSQGYEIVANASQ